MFRQSTARRAALLLRSSTAPTTTANSYAIASSRIAVQRRFASTGAGNDFTPPPPKGRSWRNRFIRLGLAGGAIYFYSTSTVFAEEPSLSLRPKPVEDTSPLDPVNEKIDLSTTPIPVSADTQIAQPQPNAGGQQQEGGLDGLESQASQEGAFNPETGEINWDCPCLGGMAHGPCGEEFKAAFSCFVYSNEEPKGMDCIEKFKGMQDCFRLHPDVYGSELQEDEVDEQLTEQIAQRDKEDRAREQQQQPEEQRENDITLQDPAGPSLNEAEKHAEIEQIRKANEQHAEK